MLGLSFQRNDSFENGCDYSAAGGAGEAVREKAMIKISLATFFFVAMAGVSANADPSNVGRSVGGSAPRLLNQDYLTSTGETVPRPGTAPLEPAGTPLDRHIIDLDDHVERGICSNC